MKFEIIMEFNKKHIKVKQARVRGSWFPEVPRKQSNMLKLFSLAVIALVWEIIDTTLDTMKAALSYTSLPD